MTAITLEAIKADQCKLAEKIAAFEVQARRCIAFPSVEFKLNEGEEYAGIITGKDGAKPHHVILLPGDGDSMTWAAAKEWAAKAGGELPTRREQSLLYANLKDQFQSSWYWSREAHASDSAYAWCQVFDYGSQNYYGIGIKLRARAVRRLIIE